MITFPITQDTKPIIRDGNGNQIVDFLEKDIVVQSPSLPPTGIGYFLVDRDHAMRVDLISNEMYGYIDPSENILKFNGISNPLSIDEGDILVTYDIFSLNRNVRAVNNSAKDKEDVRKQYLTPEKKSKIDPQLQSFNKRDTARRPVVGPAETALPPNYADFGDTEIQVRNGKIFMGPNISKSSEADQGPISKSEFIARLVKNRLNND
jgi:hypothetical protein